MLACAGTDGERNRSEIQPSGMLIWCLCLHRDSSLSSKWYHWWRREPCFYRYDPFALKFLAPLLNEMLISIKRNQNTDPFILFFHRGVFIEFRSVEISTKMVTYVVALATAAPHWVLLVSYFCLCCQRLGRPADLCRYRKGKGNMSEIQASEMLMRCLCLHRDRNKEALLWVLDRTVYGFSLAYPSWIPTQNHAPLLFSIIVFYSLCSKISVMDLVQIWTMSVILEQSICISWLYCVSLDRRLLSRVHSGPSKSWWS